MARPQHRRQRTLLPMQLNTPKVTLDLSGIEEPLYDSADINYLVSPDLRKPFESRGVLARILDGSKF